MKTAISKHMAAAMILLLVFASAALAAEGDSLWSRTYGGDSLDQANCIISSDDGGYLLAGEANTMSYLNGDAYLVKVNAQGDTLWTHTYGGPLWDETNCVISSGDGGFMLAGLTVGPMDRSYMYLVKVNASGDTLWTRAYGYPSTVGWRANSIIPSGDGGFLLAGWFGGNLYQFMFLLKVNALGDSIWSHSYGQTGFWGAHSIIPFGDGGFLMAGDFVNDNSHMCLVKVNAQGDTLWTRIYGASFDNFGVATSVIPSGDGGFLLAGYVNSPLTGSDDIYLVKVNAWGDTLWTRTYGEYNRNEGANAIIPTADGNFLVAGYLQPSFPGPNDIYLVKVNPQGDTLWTRTYGGSGDESANSAIQASDGNYLVAGYTDSYGAGGSDMWLVCVEGPSTAVEPNPSALHPSSFTLHPCHPNPFNPSTIASFELRVPSQVSLRVYDTAGKSVATLVDGWKPAGKHQARFDGSDLPSGIYLARMTAGDFQQTQKLVLLK